MIINFTQSTTAASMVMAMGMMMMCMMDNQCAALVML